MAAAVWLVFDTGFFAVLATMLILLIVPAVMGEIEQGRSHEQPQQEAMPLQPRELRALPYREYLQTPHWKRKREDKVLAAGHRCQFCNRGAVTLNVHHRTYERLGEEHDGDLTVLCQDCHHILHKHRSLGR